jgi:hypothetical protein
MPTKHLFEAWSNNIQEIVGDLAQRFIIQMSCLGPHGCLLQASSRSAATIRKQAQCIATIELYLSAS